MCSLFFNAPATTEIYTLSLHDALPIFARPVDVPARSERDGLEVVAQPGLEQRLPRGDDRGRAGAHPDDQDRKSTRLNSSQMSISYAVFCLKKKKQRTNNSLRPCERDSE